MDTLPPLPFDPRKPVYFRKSKSDEWKPAISVRFMPCADADNNESYIVMFEWEPENERLFRVVTFFAEDLGEPGEYVRNG